MPVGRNLTTGIFELQGSTSCAHRLVLQCRKWHPQVVTASGNRNWRRQLADLGGARPSPESNSRSLNQYHKRSARGASFVCYWSQGWRLRKWLLALIMLFSFSVAAEAQDTTTPPPRLRPQIPPAVTGSGTLEQLNQAENRLRQGESASGSVAPGRSFTIAQAVDMALRNYPSIAAHESRQKAVAAKVTLARTEYLPRLNLFVQELRGSTNNVLGILFPPLSIPQVAGRLNAPISFSSVWASNASAFSSWELIDFGLRHQQVKLAKAETEEAGAGVVLTKFQVTCAAAEAFFALLASHQEVVAQKANADRMRVFSTSVHSMVDSDLRPGVDASRADAEFALATDKLIQAEQEREIRRAIFAETMGVAGTSVDVEAGPLLTIPGQQAVPKLQPFEYHPLALQQSAIIKSVQARKQVIGHEWRPHITLEAALFSRGSGAEFREYVNKIGYLPSVPNWAVGLKAEFPVMSIFAIKAKERDVSSQVQQERSRYEEIMQILKSRDAQARALIDGASRLAQNAPILLKAAQDTEMRSRTRYGVGLCTVVDVAESEKLLVQAQVNFRLAGLAVWKSYLAAAEAHGDLAPFLQLVNGAGGG